MRSGSRRIGSRRSESRGSGSRRSGSRRSSLSSYLGAPSVCQAGEVYSREPHSKEGGDKWNWSVVVVGDEEECHGGGR